VRHAGHAFLAGGAPAYGEASRGDHLQTGYRLWLPGHQLEHGRVPWVDPYTFRPEVAPQTNFEAWPFGIPYWPLVSALGAVRGWNAFVLLTYVASGLLACWWLRELELPRGAALVGGLAFALAPYRAIQSGGHLLGPISMLLPLALASFERALRSTLWWLALTGAALASIPLSGQVHLALGAIPFFCLYALCRTRDLRVLEACAGGLVAAGLAGLLVRHASIDGSIGAGGRTLASVASYSANGLDFVTRHNRHGSESFVFLGWLLPVLAVAGLVVLAIDRRWGLVAALGLGGLVPILLAFGTNLPLYSALWRAFPPFRYPRVPERLMPIACLALAALAAFAVARIRPGVIAAVAVVLLVADLHVHVYRPSAADASNAAYASLVQQPQGSLLELPLFLPDSDLGSVYHYYDMQARRERPAGYSTVAPITADEALRPLRRLNCGDWTGDVRGKLRALDVRYVTFHRGLFDATAEVPEREWFAWNGLLRHGFRPQTTGGAVTLFEAGHADPPQTAAPMPAPRRAKPVYCGGWYPPAKPAAKVRTMRISHASIWVSGEGPLTILASSGAPLDAMFSVDGVPVASREVSSVNRVEARLRGSGWHLVTIDLKHLARTGTRPLGLDVVVVHRRAVR
jgi:hypothetical protein